MSFLHMSLLAGLGMISIPLLMHLFGQRQPQLIDFPALRFVRETTQEQSMSWQLRHMLLLLLRILLLAALALALARPRVHSAMLGSVLTVSALGICATLASIIAAVAIVSRRPTSIWMTATVIAVALWLSSAIWGVRSLTSGPSVPSSDQSAPVAAAILVDNGPTMSYRADNQTRMEAAKEMGLWILEKLPLDSRVGLMVGAPIGSLAMDPSTAKSQLKLLEPRGSHADLLSRIRTALDLVLASELERKEIYVISDLSSVSWAASQPDLIKLLDEHSEEVLLQIIDVGQPAAVNYHLGMPQPDFESVPAGGDVTIAIDVTASVLSEQSAAADSITVELVQEDVDPRLPVVVGDGQLELPPNRIVDRQIVELRDAPKSNSGDVSGETGRIITTTATVELTATDLGPGTHNFTVRIDRPDPLPLDNERYISILAQKQKPTLIVANDSGLAFNLQALVDPQSAFAGSEDEVVVDRVNYTQLASVQIEKYLVICLYDPQPLSTKLGQALEQHVQSGGGLFLILGPGLGTVDSVRDNSLADLFPGKLSSAAEREPSSAPVFAEPVALSHPVFFAFGESPEQMLWNLYPIYKNWTFESLADNALTLIRLSDGSAPFLTIQNRGRGQIITLTTPIPEIDSRDRELWNLLWVGEPFPAFALLVGAFGTLSGTNQQKFNYEVGQPISLSNDSQMWPSRYDLFLPDAQQRPVPAVDGMLNLPASEQPGIYRLRGYLGQPVARAVSVNVSESDTQLTRATEGDLDASLGQGNYRIARDQDEVESSVGTARFGRELYPLLMVFVAGLFLAEQAMSNRFYKVKFSSATS